MHYLERKGVNLVAWCVRIIDQRRYQARGGRIKVQGRAVVGYSWSKDNPMRDISSARKRVAAIELQRGGVESRKGFDSSDLSGVYLDACGD